MQHKFNYQWVIKWVIRSGDVNKIFNIPFLHRFQIRTCQFNPITPSPGGSNHRRRWRENSTLIYRVKLSSEEMPHVEHTQRVHKLVHWTHLLGFMWPDVPACQHHVRCFRETHLHTQTQILWVDIPPSEALDLNIPQCNWVATSTRLWQCFQVIKWITD